MQTNICPNKFERSKYKEKALKDAFGVESTIYCSRNFDEDGNWHRVITDFTINNKKFILDEFYKENITDYVVFKASDGEEKFETYYEAENHMIAKAKNGNNH